MKNLRFVLLKSAYDCWKNPLTQDLLMQTINLKLQGYGREYAYGTLPIDTFDFVGTQHLVCQEEANGKLSVIMGYKTSTLKRSRLHNLTFHGLAILENSGATEHAAAVRKILADCERSETEISYDGSWTMAPAAHQDRDLARHLKEVMAAIQVFYHEQEGVNQIIGFGMLRFKTDQYFKNLGYQAVCGNDGQPLPPFRMSTLQHEPAVLLHLTRFTDIARARAAKLESIWSNRLVIDVQDAAAERIFKAAA